MDADKLNKLGDQMMAVGCGMTLLVIGIIAAVLLLGTCLAH